MLAVLILVTAAVFAEEEITLETMPPLEQRAATLYPRR